MNPTLQSKFIYKGSEESMPIDRLTLKFNCPVFNYILNGNNNVERKVSRFESYEIFQNLKAATYQLKLPIKNFIGENSDSRMKAMMYFSDLNAETFFETGGEIKQLANRKGCLLFGGKKNEVEDSTNQNIDPFLEKFNVDIEVFYLIEEDYVIGKQNIEAILFCNFFSLPQKNKDGNVYSIDPLKQSWCLINRDRYVELIKEIRSAYPAISDYDLIFYINLFIFYSDRILDLTNNTLSSEDFIKLFPGKKQIDVEFILKVFPLLKAKDLYEFTITVPELKLFKVDGILSVLPKDFQLTKDDLRFYNLFLEYSTTDSQNISNSHSVQFDWNTNHNSITNNKIDFSFTNGIPKILNGINNPVIIQVRDFNGMVIWSKKYKPDDTELKSLLIEVSMYQPNRLEGSDVIDIVNTNKKLRGQVIELTKKCQLKDVIVVIQTKKENDEMWHIVGAANADSSGNFSMPYPFGDYVKAQAIVSLTPNSPVDISINREGKKNETISEDFLYLLINDANCGVKEDEEDCDCHSGNRPPRLPDYSDLINSDEYSQDIGGSCVNLSTPNRTLNEFNYRAIVRTSDPDVANYTLKKVDDNHFELLGDNKKIKRSIIDLDNPIRWQDAPDFQKNITLYQAVNIATGHVLHYRSQFKADGYSLGELLYSLALAPGQKKQIVVFDSSHSLQAAESQSLSQGERLAAGIVDDREIASQLGGSISEGISGSSSASTWGVGGGGALGMLAGVGGFSGVAAGAGGGGLLGMAGGYSNASSSASQNSSRNVSQFFGEKLRQSIMQNADSYRQQNASVVTTVQEGQHYAASTEVVANHNHCHALTMLYFEVLRHYAIYQELSSVEECVFVPLLMTNFSTENIYKWRDVLATRLLPMPSNTYLQSFSFINMGRQHPLLKAFDANDRIKTEYANVDFPEGSYDNEPINFFKGEINIRTKLERPKTRYDRIKSLPIISKTTPGLGSNLPPSVQAASQALGINNEVIKQVFDTVIPIASQVVSNITHASVNSSDLLDKTTLVRKQIFDAFMEMDANYETVPPAQCIRIINFKPTNVIAGGGAYTVSGLDFFEDGFNDRNQWAIYAEILGYPQLTGDVSPDDHVFRMLNYYFKGKLIAEWDEIFYNDLAPLIFTKIVNSLSINWTIPLTGNLGVNWGIAADYTSQYKYKGGEKSMKVTFNGTAAIKRKEFPLTIQLTSTDTNVKALRDYVTLIVENVKIFYSTKHYNGMLYGGYVGDDLLDGTTLYIPENDDEKRDPHKEDIYLVNKLIEHLNSNLEYYNKILWYNLDVDRRLMMLDGFNIEIYNDFGISVGFRGLGSVIKNELIAVAGNSLVFPVAAGYKISQSFITKQKQDGTPADVTLFDHYKPLTPIEPYRISVPSKGVFVEAVQGACDACEKVKENSSQDWEKFKTDEPTPIAPVITPVPTVTDWKAAFKDFATPMVNIQNAPATPVPGAGLAGLSELLGKSGIFKDITGLDANQQNAMKTYLSNMETAKAFGQMAKDMAIQGSNLAHTDKIMDSLKSAKDNGAINQDDYGKLVKQHLQQQIDGGETRRAELEKEKSPKPSLTDAAVKAADEGKTVKAEKTDKEGNSESINITEPESKKKIGDDDSFPVETNEDADVIFASSRIPKEYIVLVGGPCNTYNGYGKWIQNGAGDLEFKLNHPPSTLGEVDDFISAAKGNETHDVYWANFPLPVTRLFTNHIVSPKQNDIVTIMVYYPPFIKRQDRDWQSSPWNTQKWLTSPWVRNREPYDPTTLYSEQGSVPVKEGETTPTIDSESNNINYSVQKVSEQRIDHEIMMRSTNEITEPESYPKRPHRSTHWLDEIHMLPRKIVFGPILGGSAKIKGVLVKILLVNDPEQILNYLATGNLDANAKRWKNVLDTHDEEDMAKMEGPTIENMNDIWWDYAATATKIPLAWRGTPNIDRSKVKIIRFDYFGHSSSDGLFLKYGWNNSKGDAKGPMGEVIMSVNDFNNALAGANAIDKEAKAKLWGCSLSEFAEALTKSFPLVEASDSATTYKDLLRSPEEMPKPIEGGTWKTFLTTIKV